MRRVQKAAAVLAALALTTALAVPVWAENTASLTSTTADDSNSKQDITVKVKYERKKVYRVDLSWSAMDDFVYTAGTWNAANEGNNQLQYTGDTVGWNNTNENDKAARRVIKIVNRSNANVDVSFVYANSNSNWKDEYNKEVTTQRADETTPSEKQKIGAFFIDNNASGVDTGSYKDAMIKTGEKIWMQRADANVQGTKAQTATDATRDAAGYNVTGKAVEANIGFMMAGRPIWNTTDSTEIGTITITLSAAEDEDSLNAPLSGYARTYVQSTT